MGQRVKISPDIDAEFVIHLPETFKISGQEIYRGRNVIKKFMVDGREVAVKRFRRPNPLQAIIYSFFATGKARRAYTHALELRERGIDTPAPLAMIEDRTLGVIGYSYFVSELSDDTPLFHELVEMERYDEEKARGVGRFMAAMHEAGVLHGDPNLANILYANGSYSVIDTNRAKFKHHLSRREYITDLMRVTHRRDLLELVVQEYCRVRNLDFESTLNEVMTALRRFENNRRRRHAVKNLWKRFFSTIFAIK